MKTEIQETNLRTAHKEADKPGKKLLETLFPELKKPERIIDRVKTFEDACHELGIDDFTVNSTLSSDQQVAVNAMAMMLVITQALNEGWKPNWNNSNEFKWFPWFEMRSGFGLSFSNYSGTYSVTGVGSRLCFKSEELANYAGKQFEDIYKQYMTF